MNVFVNVILIFYCSSTIFQVFVAIKSHLCVAVLVLISDTLGRSIDLSHEFWSDAEKEVSVVLNNVGYCCLRTHRH
jgi:hypothetical protein